MDFDGLDELKLKSGEKHDVPDIKTYEPRASRAQKEYIERMLDELGYDVDNYDLDEMSVAEASELIGELKTELGWD